MAERWVYSIMRLFNFSLFVVLPGALFAQNFKQDIVAMQHEFESMKSVHIVMNVKVYVNEDENRPYYSDRIDIKKQENLYRYLYGKTEMLMNNKYIIMVDKDARQILISTRDMQGESALEKGGFQFSPDSILAVVGKARYLGELDHVKHYKVLSQGDAPETDLFIDDQNKTLRKVEYRYPDKQMVFIDFEIFEKGVALSDAVFDESNFVLITKGKTAPAESYKNYRIAIH